MSFTVCALLYGCYPQLAKRCLSSILNHPIGKSDLRIGMNQCCPETRDYVADIFHANNNVIVYEASENIGKYPMMRRMINDPKNPITTEFIMWFDDDSYIDKPTEDWLEKIKRVMTNAEMCGEIMTCPLLNNQKHWIKMQPWYNGLPLDLNPSTRTSFLVKRFAVGGWWVARTEMFKKLDWPPKNIIHRGGDHMLGEAMKQNAYRLANFNEGVAINADETGKSHRAGRRGISDMPCGTFYEPTVTARMHLATAHLPELRSGEQNV